MKPLALFLFSLALCIGCRGREVNANTLTEPRDANALPPAPAAPDGPVVAETIAVANDLPIFFVRGPRQSHERIVFLHGACTHGLGYIQAFQFAGHQHGPILALQGEHDCGHGYRSWSWDLQKTDQRIEAGFRAAGDTNTNLPTTLIGYSQGALLVEALAAKYPDKYKRIISIGSPRVAAAESLGRLEGAVMMAGTYDNRAIMKEGMAALLRRRIPSTFIEIPNARHSQLLEGERVMGEALNWLDANQKGSDAGGPAAMNAATTTEPLTPLTDAAWLETLELGDGDSAVVAVPLGATEPRPIMLGVHGAGDRPEWACGGWRLANRAYPFIVCPRGSPMSSTAYAWRSSDQIERVSLKAIEAVKKRFGKYAMEGPYVYAGFSQGATAAPPFLLKHSSKFPTIIFAEGAYESVASPDFARQLKKGGVSTLILVCGTGHCVQKANAARPHLERAGLTVFIGGDPRAGHNLNAPMQQALAASWPTWFAHDPAWASFSR